jgi:phosphoglycolate phosphatase-like HAD superfamily hydrolase
MATIFDCDGTLADSERLANEVLVDFVAEFGLSLALDDAVSQFRGQKMATCVALLEARLGRPLPSSFVPEFRSEWPRRSAIDRRRSRTVEIFVAHRGVEILRKVHLTRPLPQLSLALAGDRDQPHDGNPRASDDHVFSRERALDEARRFGLGVVHVHRICHAS